MIRHVPPALAAAALALAALPAAARDDDPGPPTKVVSYRDLDLAKPQDARILMGRLRSAAAAVCRDAGRDVDRIAGFAEVSRCYDSALQTAVHRIDRPTLTAMYTRKPVVPLSLAAR